MKRVIILLSIISNICFGQITYETTYTSPHEGIQVVNLSNTLTVYQSFNPTNNQVTLFNQNHSIYKSFIIPAQPGTYGFGWGISGYFSETLFNADNLIEYMLINSNPPINMTNNNLHKIYNESGTLLFQKDSIISNGIGEYIFNSPAGAKMFLSQVTNTIGDVKRHVYSLPGTIFQKVNEINKTNSELSVFPNPSNSYFKAEYKLPDNITEGIMEIYNINGQLMKSYRISNKMNDILIDATEFSAGSYSLKVIAENTVITNKLIKL